MMQHDVTNRVTQQWLGRCAVVLLLASLHLKAMKTLSFCALSVSCSLVQHAAAWGARSSSLPHAHQHQHAGHRRSLSRHSPVVWAGGCRVPRHACRTRATAPLVASAAAGTSTSSKEVAGYEVDESGRCTGVEALPPLKNRYYALRHGQSVANMEGIISSDPKLGSVKHGLTSNGRSQARVAATAVIEVVGRERLDSLVFVSSEFLRARQTAEECRAAIQNILSFERQAMTEGSSAEVGGDETAGEDGAEAKDDGGGGGGSGFSLDEGDIGGYDVSPPVVIRAELRERSFGELDGTILVNYNKVWPEDLKDGSQEGHGVESVCDVAKRVGRLVRSLEQDYEDADIIFSSHADTLQIAQCYFAGADERLFSQYRFKNGEVRSLLRDPSSLPQPAPLSFQ